MMNANQSRVVIALSLIASAAFGTQARAATYQLKADVTTVTMPDGAVIDMWGFGLLTDPEVSVPGPVLEVLPGDDTLTIELTNYLPEAVSVVIPGQISDFDPVWNDGTTGDRTDPNQRVVSFAPEAAAGGGMASFTWTGLRPGTYLYHSGRHPAVQVQMGLYGAMIHDELANEVYAGVPYVDDVLLLFSEIDPAVHTAVVAGDYGTAAYPSPTEYHPRYFLINGAPYDGQPAIPAAGATDRVLLRMINAGLQSKVPTLQSLYMRLVAEDGFVAPYEAEQYSTLLAAGQTRDAILTAAGGGTYAIYDRSLHLMGGGMLAFLEVGDAPIGPIWGPAPWSTQPISGGWSTVHSLLSILGVGSEPPQLPSGGPSPKKAPAGDSHYDALGAAPGAYRPMTVQPEESP